MHNRKDVLWCRMHSRMHLVVWNRTCATLRTRNMSIFFIRMEIQIHIWFDSPPWPPSHFTKRRRIYRASNHENAGNLWEVFEQGPRENTDGFGFRCITWEWPPSAEKLSFSLDSSFKSSQGPCHLHSPVINITINGKRMQPTENIRQTSNEDTSNTCT